jgi:hypothetical protein
MVVSANEDGKNIGAAATVKAPAPGFEDLFCGLPLADHRHRDPGGTGITGTQLTLQSFTPTIHAIVGRESTC